MSLDVEGEIPYAKLVASFIVLVYLLHTYLDLRQFKSLRRKDLPVAVASTFSADTFEKSRSYSLDKWWFSFVYDFVSLAQSLFLLYCEGLPLLWSFARQCLSSLSPHFSGEIVTTIGYVGLLVSISSLLDIPWSVYKTFVLEQRHGFNKQTTAGFVQDVATTWLLGLVFLPPMVAGVTWILLRSDQWLPIYLWLFLLAVTVVMMTVYPVFIAPLFNKFEPLSKESLRAKIETLAGRLGFPLKKLFTMDGSKRSAHSNAYMYGLFNNKRIVLFDTLISQCTEDEVTAVLAHELGHWKLSHNLYNFVTMQLVILLQFLLFSLIRSSENLFESFGFTEEKPVFVSLVLFSFISAPVNEIVDLMHNVVSRRFEFQADNFAVSLGMGSTLRAALITLETSNKASLNVDPWYSAYHFSHPPLLERLKAIDAAVGKME